VSATPESTARLIVETGPHRGTRFVLSRETSCHLGSDASCELRLTGPGIAPRHVVVKALANGGFGAKCLDTEFTLNDRAMQAARLGDGDVLQIGDTRVRFAVGPEQNGGAARDHRVGQTLGGFRLLRVLGAGGMGTVFEAKQLNLDRTVALKVLSKDLTSDPVFVARFVAEARAAARLHHPNVVQVFDVGHEGDTFYYSMEVMHEGSLEQRVKANGPLPVEEAVTAIADAARGLAYAESLRIVHRDIKPDNLMVDQHGSVKIADLGLAMTDENNVSKVIGTPHFMSPEQALGKPLDHRSDLYSLGCTFYRLLTGGTPFRGESVKDILRAQVKEAHEPVIKVRPDVPADVSALVDSLLEKDPEKRCPSAAILLEQLEAVLAPPSRRGLWIAGITVAVLLAGAGLVWGLTRPEGKTIEKINTIKDRTTEEALRADLRERDAEIARLRVHLAQTDELERAAALEAMAQEHDGTEAANVARSDAEALRRAHREAEAERQRQAQAVAAAVASLQQSVDAALAQSDYRRATQLLADDAPAELRGAPALAKARADLDAAVHRHAADHLARLRTALDDARAQRAPDALADVVAKLALVIDAEHGWPPALVPDRTAVEASVLAGRSFLTELQTELASESAMRAWTRYASAVCASDGPLAAARDLRFADAARSAADLASALPDCEAGAHADHLAASLRSADAFLARFVAAAAAHAIAYTPSDAARTSLALDDSGERLEVLGFTPSGPDAGLSVRTGPTIRPRTQIVPIAMLRGPQLAKLFRIPKEPNGEERGAFLAWMTIADHVAWTRDCLSAIGTAPDQEVAYAGDLDVIREARAGLRASTAPWAAALTLELDAVETAASALRSFATRRGYQATVNYVERLLRLYPHSLLVASVAP
jgi:serine/threonine-protein kinase